MAATPSSSLEPGERAVLLRTAAEAIEARLARRSISAPDLAALPAGLRAERASFVTLTTQGRLRGCCGSLEAHRPLAVDVWVNAQASAFHDPRFAPLESREWAGVDLEVSVLSRLERMEVRDEADLLERLVPGETGLVLEWRGRRATFLPKVWAQLPEPRRFLAQLRHKAGLNEDFWAGDLQLWRYRTEVLVAERPPRSVSSAAP